MVGWARRKSGILPTEPCWDEDPADHEVFKIAQSVSPAIPHELAQEASPMKLAEGTLNGQGAILLDVGRHRNATDVQRGLRVLIEEHLLLGIENDFPIALRVRLRVLLWVVRALLLHDSVHGNYGVHQLLACVAILRHAGRQASKTSGLRPQICLVLRELKPK